MIATIARLIDAERIAKGCPIPIVYGPERAPQGVASSRVVISRLPQRPMTMVSADELKPAVSQHGNPPMPFVRACGCQIHIYAQSTKAGAMIQDHERIADAMADLVIVALQRLARTQKRSPVAFRSCGFLGADALALAGVEGWPGVVYEIQCTIDRGVFDVDWAGAAAAEATVGGDHGVSIATTVDVSRDGSDRVEHPTSGGTAPPDED